MHTTGSGLGLLEWALNRVLAADPEVHERLGEVEGARVRIVVTPLLRPLELAFVRNRMEVSWPANAEDEDEDEDGDGDGVDVTISGSGPALAAFLLEPDARNSLPPGVSVKGDLSLAMRLGRLARCYRFDWEELLSRYLGDAGAHETARHARAAGRWGLGAADTLARDVAEYLSEESGLVAGGAALGRFCDAVDELRDDVERLEARITGLLRRAEEERP